MRFLQSLFSSFSRQRYGSNFLPSVLGKIHPYAKKEVNKPAKEANAGKMRFVLKGYLPFESHQNYQCNIADFDWVSGPSERNWWWNMQQLPSLYWGLGYNIKRKNDNYSHEVAEYNEHVIDNWIAVEAKDSPLRWHDHATAIRAYNLYRWINWCLVNKYSLSRIPDWTQLVIEHLDWLVKKKNYSKNTNHGFEQAWMTLSICLGWPLLKEGHKAYKVSVDRLENEINTAFTDEGVHKENSPGYHAFMLKRLNKISRLLKRYGFDSSRLNLDERIEKGERFLDAIAFESNELPLIGDTVSKEKYSEQVAQLREKSGLSPYQRTGFYDFSKSGYMIYKKINKDGQEAMHLVMKSCYMANYHRHDDDLAIHLCIQGDVVFGDSGLYGHDKTSHIRQYMRSPYAHSTVFPKGVTQGPRRVTGVKKKPTLEFDSELNSTTGWTYQYAPLIFKRRLRVWPERNQFLKVTDRVYNKTKGSEDIVSSFILGYLIEISNVKIFDNYVEISLPSFMLIIHYDPRVIKSVELSSGYENSITKTAVISRKLGEVNNAVRLELVWTAIANTSSHSVYHIEVYWL